MYDAYLRSSQWHARSLGSLNDTFRFLCLNEVNLAFIPDNLEGALD